MRKAKVAIVGSGNIGTDLMFKIMRTSDALEMSALAGIDSESDGLARARKLGVATTDRGLEGLVAMPEWRDIAIVFDATSAKAHLGHDRICRAHGKRLIDLTPAAAGPYCVPVVNIAATIDEPNINMVSCGGQAAIPIVHAVKRVSQSVPYAEVVASMSSRSAGPGTRANIDEVTQTTAKGIEILGGADKGKAIVILNPAEPPMLMRNTIYTLSLGSEEAAVEKSIRDIVAEVSAYVPGYRLKHDVQFEKFGDNRKVRVTGVGEFTGLKSTVLLEVEGAAHYLPAYAGNLDIMTSAGLRTGEHVARRLMEAADGR